MEKAELENLLKKAIDKLLSKDRYLLEHDVNERTITHKLAMYITEFAKYINGFDWDIDVEYNRNKDKSKGILNADNLIVGVYPDILIHKRGKDNFCDWRNNNLLIIELKKNASTKGKSKDIDKIQRFINQSPYYYNYGMFINFKTGDNQSFHIEWVE